MNTVQDVHQMRLNTFQSYESISAQLVSFHLDIKQLLLLHAALCFK